MKSKGEIVLICAGIGFAVAMLLMFPGVRHALFQPGAPTPQEAGPGVTTAMALAAGVDTPRNAFPMAQYTPYFKKVKFTQDDGNVKRYQYYYWFEPPKPYAPGQKFPLVVVLHDTPGMAHGAVYLRMTATQKEFPSFILVPLEPENKVWAAPKKYSGHEFPPGAVPPAAGGAESLTDVLRLLGRLTAVYPVDESRLYVVGCGEGGTGVYGAVSEYPGIFAGGVAMNAIWSFLDARKLAKTPLLIRQGLLDTSGALDFARNLDPLIKRAGGNVFYGEVSDATHDCENPKFYTRAVWQWLFTQKLVKAAAPPPVSNAAPPPVSNVVPAAPAAAAAAPAQPVSNAPVSSPPVSNPPPAPKSTPAVQK